MKFEEAKKSLRKIMSTDDMIQEFALALRTSSQTEAPRIALQVLGDLTGFGIQYFDFDNAGYVKTATEVSSDNSQLMRSIARHEHALERSIAGICRSLMSVSRSLGESIPDEGSVRGINISLAYLDIWISQGDTKTLISRC